MKRNTHNIHSTKLPIKDCETLWVNVMCIRKETEPTYQTYQNSVFICSFAFFSSYFIVNFSVIKPFFAEKERYFFSCFFSENALNRLYAFENIFNKSWKHKNVIFWWFIKIWCLFYLYVRWKYSHFISLSLYNLST